MRVEEAEEANDRDLLDFLKMVDSGVNRNCDCLTCRLTGLMMKDAKDHPEIYEAAKPGDFVSFAARIIVSAAERNFDEIMTEAVPVLVFQMANICGVDVQIVAGGGDRADETEDRLH